MIDAFFAGRAFTEHARPLPRPVPNRSRLPLVKFFYSLVIKSRFGPISVPLPHQKPHIMQNAGSYRTVEKRCAARVLMACPEGLEPPTCCLEGSCSIQLSYGHLRAEQEGNGRGGGIRTHDPLLPKQMRYQAALRPDTRKRILASPGNPHQINGLYSRDKLSLPEGRISDI